MSIEGQGHFLPYIFQVSYVLCFSRPRYQVSVYRTIGPLVFVTVTVAFIKMLMFRVCLLTYEQLHDKPNGHSQSLIRILAVLSNDAV